MTTASSPETNGEGPDEMTASQSPEATDQDAGDGASEQAELAEPESELSAERAEDDLALATEGFSRAPHQWSLPAYGPVNDAVFYRQIVGYLGPPPTLKRPRGLVMGCGVMVAMLVALMGLSGFYALRLARAQVSQRESAISVAATIALFCEAAQNRDYSGAYRYLSPAFQGQTPIDTFVAANETHDETDGAITSCTARTDLLHASVSGSHTSVTLEVARSRTVVGTITLTRGAQGWQIDTLDPLLKLD